MLNRYSQWLLGLTPNAVVGSVLRYTQTSHHSIEVLYCLFASSFSKHASCKQFSNCMVYSIILRTKRFTLTTKFKTDSELIIITIRWVNLLKTILKIVNKLEWIALVCLLSCATKLTRPSEFYRNLLYKYFITVKQSKGIIGWQNGSQPFAHLCLNIRNLFNNAQ